eukprot:c18101_g1_i4.p1 GENE.c18101_g1_i4~~c18101_g1_i4.p1  ORF type:complete len:156 (-),score=54.63 c18101_g1_i4:23-490(-)
MIVESIIQAVCCGLMIFCLGRQSENTLLFVLRATTNGILRVAYLYTGEVYPSNIKSTALGFCSSVARIGGMITPYIAQVVTNHSDKIGLGIYVFASLLLALTAGLLPIDTNGVPIPQSLDELHLRVQHKRKSFIIKATDSTALLSTNVPVYSPTV